MQFERDRGDDPFGVEAMISEAAKGAGKRAAEDEGSGRGKGKGKKARVDDE